MKTKNLILALLAVVLAVSSAFSTKDVAGLNPNVKILMKFYPWSSWQCSALPTSCNTSGPYICKINVVKWDLTTRVTNAYIATNPTCTTHLYDDDLTIPSYDPGVDERPFDVWGD
jgi:hypothetical protein